MRACVPSLLEKVSRYQPLMICFVGMAIWTIVKKGMTAKDVVLPANMEIQKRKSNEKAKSIGVQEYILVHTETSKETHIWVVPSTSGRVTTYQVFFPRTASHV